MYGPPSHGGTVGDRLTEELRPDSGVSRTTGGISVSALSGLRELGTLWLMRVQAVRYVYLLSSASISNRASNPSTAATVFSTNFTMSFAERFPSTYRALPSISSGSLSSSASSLK